MIGQDWYTLLVAAIAAQRLGEVVVAKRNLAWSLSRGGVETGFSHYPFMILLHTTFLLGCITEVRAEHRPFIPALGWPLLVIIVLAQGARIWCIHALGRQWNTRVIVVPGMVRVTTGPYHYLRHPNYLIVVVEGLAIPLLHSAWITATVFTVLNAVLLRVRIQCENTAWATPPDPSVPAQPTLGV